MESHPIIPSSPIHQPESSPPSKTGSLRGKKYSQAAPEKKEKSKIPLPDKEDVQTKGTEKPQAEHDISSEASIPKAEKTSVVYQEQLGNREPIGSFHIHEVELANAPPLHPISPEHIEAVNTKLKRSGISLTCRQILPELPAANKNAILTKKRSDYLKFLSSLTREKGKAIADENVGQKYIELLTVPDLAHRIVENIDIISYEDLTKGLGYCISTLNSLLGDQDYSLGYAPGKSQEWLSGQALPYMQKAPTSTFSVDASGSGSGTSQGALNAISQRYVLFDDASYSGKQVREMVVGLAKAIVTQDPHAKDIQVYLVVPFISETGQQLLLSSIETDINVKKLGLQVHLITTDKKVKSMNEVLTPEEMRDLSKATKIDHSHHCLTIMEWKIPDGTSFPPPFQRALVVQGEGEDLEIRRFPLFTDNPPPYKSKLPPEPKG